MWDSYEKVSVRRATAEEGKRCRRTFVLVMSVLVTGCSTVRPEPLTGVMWAYIGESESVPSLRTLVYALDRPTCEVNRAKDMNLPPNAAWARLKIPGACRQIVVFDGADYWVFQGPGPRRNRRKRS